MRPDLRSTRGFTLVEAMIVIVLAAVVGFGLVGFYLNSQATWLDASTQAIAQRDATLMIDAITNQGRQWASAELGSDSVSIRFRDGFGAERDRFYLDVNDHRIYHVEDVVDDRGPVTDTYVERLCLRLTTTGIVRIDTLRVRSAEGEQVQLSSIFALYNSP
jgi:type II secretory pathway pseudopilin PulG